MTVSGTFISSESESHTMSTLGGTTVEHTDSTSKRLEMNQLVGMPHSLIESSSTGYMQGIKEFLAKPVKVTAGTFQSTDSLATFTKVPAMTTLLYNSLVMDKIKGFFAIRATMVYTLHINATRFQQGRYILAYVPAGGSEPLATGRSDAWYLAHTKVHTQITQLPHVEIDVATETEVQIKIPFHSAYVSYPINDLLNNDALNEPGFVCIFPYISMSTGTGSSVCNYTLFGHLEDVELFAPTIPITQSGRAFKTYKKTRKVATEEEQDKIQAGPVGHAFSRVREVSNILGEIPLLSSVTKPISWVAELASKSAGVFGWSKPADLGPVQRTLRGVFPYMANTDGADTGNILAGCSSNLVNHLPGFAGTDIDEMSIDHVKSIPSYIGAYDWTTSNASGVEILSRAINIHSLGTTHIESGVTLYNWTPVGFLGRLFEYFRGGLLFKFKFVKTEFHSGRLMFSFTPNYQHGVNPTITADATSFVHRHIVDLRDATEFTFYVPYTALSEYLAVLQDTYGYLTVHVLDPLVCPATVSSTVKILVEVSGAPDLEFAVPRHHGMRPTFPVTIEEGRSPSQGEEIALIVPQSGLSSLVSRSLEATSIGNSSAANMTTDYAESCIGERITSLRALLRKPALWHNSWTNSTGKWTLVQPTAVTVVASLGSAIDVPGTATDYYDLFGSIYCYSRGGIRIKTQLPSAADTDDHVTQVFADMPASTTVATDVSKILINPPLNGDSLFTRIVSIFRGDLTGGTEFTVPMYHHTHARANVSNLCSTAGSFPYFDRTTSTAVGRQRVVLCPSTGVVYNFYRSGADDANFGGFVSIPPMYMPPNEIGTTT